jgi:hypothetical protein
VEGLDGDCGYLAAVAAARGHGRFVPSLDLRRGRTPSCCHLRLTRFLEKSFPPRDGRELPLCTSLPPCAGTPSASLRWRHQLPLPVLPSSRDEIDGAAEAPKIHRNLHTTKNMNKKEGIKKKGRGSERQREQQGRHHKPQKNP